MLRLCVVLLAAVACTLAATPVCTGSAPFGCVSTFATFSNPVSQDITKVCYYGAPSCAALGTVSQQNSNSGKPYCPCAGTAVQNQADPTTSPPGYPNQIRWGTPQDTSNSGTKKSGFGFRGTTGVAVASPGQLFYFGMVAHLNYVITGGALTQWNLNMNVDLLLPGASTVQSSTFTMTLSLEETSNYDCAKGTDCFGDVYWNAYPDSLIRPDCTLCPRQADSILDYSINGDCSGTTSNRPCCPFRTIDKTCADRVRTLSSFSATSDPFVINGLEYQVYLAGFSVPGTQGQVSRDYFVSQETQSTNAELWGKLVVKCPSSSVCQGNYTLDSTGTQCQCVCIAPNAGACPIAGQVRGSDCVCRCANNCGSCGTAVLSGGACGCSCNATCCPGRQVASGGSCACSCPSNACTAPKVITNGADSSCPCGCPNACASGQVQNPTTCACSCPASTCVAPQVVSFDSNQNKCVCSCPANSCTSPKTLIPNDPNCGCQCPACSNTNQILNPSTCACACPSCPSPQIPDPASQTCGCKCPTCPSPKVVVNQATCQCGCPTSCPGNQVQDPSTCGCSCPACPGAQVLDTSSGSACTCKCPTCPGSQTLINPTGTDCGCACANTCPGRQVLDGTTSCGCVCPSSACASGLVPKSSGRTSACECVCPTNTCPSGKVLQNPSATVTSLSQCTCICQASDCTAHGAGSTVVDPNAQTCQCTCPTASCTNGGSLVAGSVYPNCPCNCPTCPGTVAGSAWTQAANCGCSCPLTNATCAAQNDESNQWELNATICACVCTRSVPCGCKCTPVNAPCYNVSAICTSDGKCPVVNKPNNLACGTNNACVSNKCQNGACVSTSTDCSNFVAQQITKTADRVCYSASCDTGLGCKLAFATGVCTGFDLVAAFGADNAQCYTTACTAAPAAPGAPSGGCLPTFHANQQCSIDLTTQGWTAADLQCVNTKCVATSNSCAPVAAPSATCALDLVALLGADDSQCYSSVCGTRDGHIGCVPQFQSGYQCTIDLAARYGADNAQCYSTACTDGACTATFAEGSSCVLDSLADDASDAQCFYSECRTVDGAGICTPVFDDTRVCVRDLVAEYGAVDAQCYSNECSDNGCADVFALNQPCTLASLNPNPEDAQCYQALCTDLTATGGGKGCKAVFDDSRACSIDDLNECYYSDCTAGGCASVYDATRPCTVDTENPTPVCLLSGCTEDGCAYLFDSDQEGDKCDYNLSTVAPDEASLVCYTAECVSPDGCTAVFHADLPCDLNLTAAVGANNVTCYTSTCADGRCQAVFNPNGYCLEGSGPVPGAAGCYLPVCDAVSGGCVWAPQTDAPCQDGDLCTVDPTLRDPSTGEYADRCTASDGVLACIGSKSPCDFEYASTKNSSYYACISDYEARAHKAASQSVANNCARNVAKRYPDACLFKCFSDVSGQFCIDPCAVPSSKSKSDKAAIIAGVVVGTSACLFAMAALIFGYVKWGHQRLMGLLRGSDFNNNMLSDNAIYEGANSTIENVIAEH